MPLNGTRTRTSQKKLENFTYSKWDYDSPKKQKKMSCLERIFVVKTHGGRESMNELGSIWSYRTVVCFRFRQRPSRSVYLGHRMHLTAESLNRLHVSLLKE